MNQSRKQCFPVNLYQSSRSNAFKSVSFFHLLKPKLKKEVRKAIWKSGKRREREIKRKRDREKERERERERERKREREIQREKEREK